MTHAQYSKIKSTMGALKRWGQAAHLAKDYRRRNALFSRYDDLALRLYRR